MLRGDEGLDIRGGFINSTDEEEVPQAVTHQTRSCERRMTGGLTRRARSGMLNAENSGI